MQGQDCCDKCGTALLFRYHTEWESGNEVDPGKVGMRAVGTCNFSVLIPHPREPRPSASDSIVSRVTIWKSPCRRPTRLAARSHWYDDNVQTNNSEQQNSISSIASLAPSTVRPAEHELWAQLQHAEQARSVRSEAGDGGDLQAGRVVAAECSEAQASGGQ